MQSREVEWRISEPRESNKDTMPRSFLVKSKRAHSYHQPRYLDDGYGRLDTILAHVCAGRFICA